MLVETVRWFNRASPWHQIKPSLTKRALRLIEDSAGPQWFAGIQGSLRMRLDLRSQYEQKLFFNSYEAPLIAILRSVLQPGDVFVDGGANLGLFTLVASQLVGPTGRVYAFEPAPLMAERLREHISANSAANVQVIEKGLWDTPGHAALHSFAGATAEGVSMRKRQDRTVEHTWSIETARIDDVVEGTPRMLKLDVEGAELPALRGAERCFSGKHQPHVLAELKRVTAQTFGYDPLDLIKWLRAKGDYRLRLLTSRHSRALELKPLKELLDDQPAKTHNVWFQPLNRSPL